MRCKYTKFLYRANGCEIFFFDLTISLLTFLLENTKINQVLLSLNDRFFIGNDIYADRIDLNGEINKSEKDQEKITAINGEVKELYAQIMANKNMSAYNDAKNEVDGLVDFVMQILRGSLDGEDPDQIEQKSGGCSGSCSSCSGCH